MVLTPSTMLKLGTSAPDFQLTDVVSGKATSLASFTEKKSLLVMFICVHCPFVIHIEEELGRLGQDYRSSDLGIVAINANDADTHPEDAPDKLKAMALRLNFPFPYCHDETQSTAKAYTAACTPDFFLYGPSRELVYRGQLDDSRPENGQPNDGRDLRVAIEAVLADRDISSEQKPSVGCNIKWKVGNEPKYFG